MEPLGDYKRKKGRGELERKLMDLEKQMRDLHDKLMEEKLKLGGGGGGGDLPTDWPSMNRLHLPHCPMVRRTAAPSGAVATPKYNPDCAVHGGGGSAAAMASASSASSALVSPPGFLSCPVEYAKKLSQAEEECREEVARAEQPGPIRPPVAMTPSAPKPSPVASPNGAAPSLPPPTQRLPPSPQEDEESTSSEEEYVPYSAVKKASQELFNIEDYVQTAISKLRV